VLIAEETQEVISQLLLHLTASASLRPHDELLSTQLVGRVLLPPAPLPEVVEDRG
jgi:hypothetical protein